MSIILASQSPRRRQLLQMLGLSFRVEAADIDETICNSCSKNAAVARLSAQKAAKIAEKYPSDFVVAADTIVVLDGKILGKPQDEAEAFAMLRSLSGKTHEVLTGLTVQQGERSETVVISTKVRFRPLSDSEISAYIKTGEPMDKAGAYGIQGLGSVFVESLDGDFFSVMGLPVQPLCKMLRNFGIPVLDTCETR